MTGLIGAIWAQASNGVIGDGESLLWHLPEDLKHFSSITNNQTVIMGRRTWDSLPEKFRPLPNRENFVISRNMQNFDGAKGFTSIDEALANVTTEEAWFIGGGQIYEACLPFVTRLELTIVEIDVQGETLAPSRLEGFRLLKETEPLISAKGLEYKFKTLSK